MKECPKCFACYEPIIDACPVDNTPLEEGMPGSTILAGKFRVESRLGKGGMSIVYKAMHLGLKRYVAIKILQEQQDKAGFLERFRREAEAIGQIKHPNVIDVMDFGFVEIEGKPLGYLVMEFLEGSTLSVLLKKKIKLPLEDAVAIMEQICVAVEAAHKLGIIHRDLKPDNIWLENNSSNIYKVKVLDFGLAKLTNYQGLNSVDEETVGNKTEKEALPDKDLVVSNVKSPSPGLVDVINKTPFAAKESSADKKRKPYQTNSHIKLQTGEMIGIGTEFFNGTFDELTQTGAMVGTLPYMSPEQCLASPVTVSSDIYALGIIAYEMLAGVRPFLTKGFELAAQHLNDTPPSLRELLPNLPKAVEDAVFCALAKEPESRPKSAIEFSNLFGAYLREKQHKKARLQTTLRWSIAFSALALTIITVMGNRLLLKEYYYQATSSLGWSNPKKIIQYYSEIKLINTLTKQETILATTPKEIVTDFNQSQNVPNRFNAQFSLDGKLAVLHWIRENTPKVEVWDVTKTERLYEVAQDALPNRLRNAHFSKDGRYLILSNFNKIHILDVKTGKLLSQVTTYERNDYIQVSSANPNLIMVGSLRRPVIEHRLGTTIYPIDETSSLLSIWDISTNRKISDISQQFGEIEFIYSSSSKTKDLALIQWHVAQKEPSRYIELVDFNGAIKQKWQVKGIGGGAISLDGNKIAVCLSPDRVTEFDLNSNEQIAEYILEPNNSVEKISYDKDGVLSMITGNYVVNLYTKEYSYKLSEKASIIDANKVGNAVLVERQVFIAK